MDPDEGVEFIDKAATLLPTAPLLPMIEAVRFGDHNHNFDQYDIITGRGELKKLLSWVSSKQQKDFRIDIEKKNQSTLVLRRWELTNISRDGVQVKGQMGQTFHYRKNFETLTCLPVEGNEKAFSHQRVVSYVRLSLDQTTLQADHFLHSQDLCGLRMLVQCEVDGFTVDTSDTEAFAEEHCRGDVKESVTDLIEALDNMTIKTKQAGSASADKGSQASPLSVVPYGGYETSHDGLLELKTRSARNPFPLEASEIYAQAVWSGTPTTIVALHHNGNFQEEQIYKLSELEKMDSTAEMRENVNKVGFLLKTVMRELKAEPAGSKFCLLSKKAQPEVLYLKEGGRGAGLLSLPRNL